MTQATGRGMGGMGSSDGTEISAEELAALLGTQHAPFLLDVREPEEFESWAISGAANVPLSSLEHRLTQVARDRQVVVVCASGQRSAQAAGALRSAGIDASNLLGGMLAWSAVYDTVRLDVGAFSVVQVRRRSKGCLSYVVGSGGEALVVDPSSEIDRYRDLAAAEGWQITHVLDTHVHADHVSGARALAAATGSALHLSTADALRYGVEALAERDRILLGTTSVDVLATPGHTMGSVVVDLGGGAMLTGDTLFVDGVGRPDLADAAREYAEALHHSLVSLLDGRSDDVLVLPAHFGAGVTVVRDEPVAATLGAVRAAVPQLGWERERFVSWASTRATPRPPSYVEIVRLNVGETWASADEVRALEVGPNRCGTG
ncbi:MAG TPA: rhodanese-like domain-containing protein [Acidimicrobiales bacterium]|nr:rhodanese-like domain-containing protein [Acidimicrobiales bacterium]